MNSEIGTWGERAPKLVLVLTMGRVGSSSVYRSIPDVPGLGKFHVHSINVKTLTRQVVRHGSLEASPRSVRDGIGALQAILRHAGPVHVVSLVREPVSRDISAAFASLRANRRIEELGGIVEDPEQVKAFWVSFRRGRAFTWFDEEIRDVLGIDVYDSPVSPEGWQVMSNDRFRLLVMRSELGAEAQAKILSDFLGFEAFPLKRVNDQGSAPRVAALYQRFKENLTLGEAVLAEYRNSRYARHFYPAG